MVAALPQFQLRPISQLSKDFLSMGLTDYHSAVEYVWALPYGRNSNRADYSLVLHEGRGTCATKHALLAQVALDHEMHEIQLCIGIYEMNEQNTPGVGKILDQYGLPYLPEAHCYLKVGEERYDFTRIETEGEKIQCFLLERTIEPSGIEQLKMVVHQDFLKMWIATGVFGIRFTFEKIWKVREECIQALSEPTVSS